MDLIQLSVSADNLPKLRYMHTYRMQMRKYNCSYKLTELSLSLLPHRVVFLVGALRAC